MNNCNDYYQDGLKLPVEGDEPKTISLRDYLKHHCDACRLLGEAQGMLHVMLKDMTYVSKEHYDGVRQAVNGWNEKVTEFVEKMNE